MSRPLQVAGLALCAATLGGCATIYNAPINLPLATADAATLDGTGAIPTNGDDVLVGLTFSGGGTRAAAFSYGVLQGFDHTSTARGTPLLDSVHYISGVSGGAITAAYFGLKGRSAFSDYPERFLLRNAEESLDTPLTPVGIIRAYQGGTNEAHQFTQWLDQNLFQGATFKQLDAPGHPHILINASDIYNRTPFVFNETTFKAICSDLNSYPVANAVAASATMPLIFAPMVLTSYADRCRAPLPKWVTQVQNDPGRAAALESIRRGHRALSQWLGPIHRAARWRRSGFLWPRRIYHLAIVGGDCLRAADVAAGGQDLPRLVYGGGCRAGPVRRLGAKRGRPDGA